MNFPFISENGGGIFFPLEYKKDLGGCYFNISEDLIKLTLGKPYKAIVDFFYEIRQETGLNIRGFSQMSREEVMALTDLNEKKCVPALEREFDEPFILENTGALDESKLYRSAEKRGLKISEGGRFYHLHGDSDKGSAVKWLISFYEKKYKKTFTIALGDSPNDFGMFDVVNQPILVKSSKVFTDIRERYPKILITDKYGPEGWNEAVMGLLKTEREDLSDV